LFDLLTAQRIHLEPDAIAFAASELNDDRLTVWASSVFNIRTSNTGTSAVSLSIWAEAIQSIFEMRELSGIGEQIRRLGIPSHEALDTDLVIRIAGKYHRAGFNVAFEPNGRECSDLLIESQTFRSYAEIKRENQQDHKRHASVMRASWAVLSSAGDIRTWLEDRELRMELTSIVPSVIGELRRRLQTVEVGKEQQLDAVSGSRYIVLQRQDDPFYRKGILTAKVVVRQPGTPVQLVPKNMPVLVIFDWLPNLKALKQRLQKASMQLSGDALKDPDAQGFVVLEMSHGELAKDALVEHFSLLPGNCLGVMLRSDHSYLVPRSDVTAEAVEILMLAGTP
jgi:hypothetical protein